MLNSGYFFIQPVEFKSSTKHHSKKGNDYYLFRFEDPEGGIIEICDMKGTFVSELQQCKWYKIRVQAQYRKFLEVRLLEVKLLPETFITLPNGKCHKINAPLTIEEEKQAKQIASRYPQPIQQNITTQTTSTSTSATNNASANTSTSQK